MKKIFLKIMTFGFLIYFTQTKAQIPIDGSFYGLNLWFSSYGGAPTGSFSTLSGTEWGISLTSGAKMMRAGGKSFDVGSARPP